MSENLASPPAQPHPSQLQVQEFGSYSLVIDARSPREFEEDHVPGAINLPVVNNEEYAEVGTLHRSSPHEAYLIGVEYSLRNIARQIRPLISKYKPSDRFLVYCFRGGKRSRLWAENLRIIGFKVDVLPGGWKNYRRWVREALEQFPQNFEFRVLSGPTGCGKTRLLQALQAEGAQVLDLEGLACHRGSLIGAVPGQAQPSQKWFDSLLLDSLRRFDPDRPVWVEAESKKIGNLQLPQALHDAMHRATPVSLVVPMPERVKIWREDYRHFVDDPVGMVAKLEPLKPLVGNQEMALWQELAHARRVDELFERVMVAHYDPCYARSTRSHYRERAELQLLEVPSVEPHDLCGVARDLIRRFGA